MRVPVGHRAGIELDPIDLAGRDPDDGPIGAKDLGHEAAARDDVAEFMDVHAGNLRRRGSCAAGQDRLLIFAAYGEHSATFPDWSLTQKSSPRTLYRQALDADRSISAEEAFGGSCSHAARFEAS